MLDTGRGGENWLAAHLQRQGWQLLAHRWRCQWGELDLVMLAGEVVVFIEVKTRKAGNWDADGAAAITPVNKPPAAGSSRFPEPTSPVAAPPLSPGCGSGALDGAAICAVAVLNRGLVVNRNLGYA